MAAHAWCCSEHSHTRVVFSKTDCVVQRSLNKMLSVAGSVDSISMAWAKYVVLRNIQAFVQCVMYSLCQKYAVYFVPSPYFLLFGSVVQFPSYF